MESLILIDGNSLINRAYFAMPPLTLENGQQTQAVFGFTNMLIKLITDYKPTRIVATFDLPKPTFRHKLYSKYKGTRKKMDDELASQLPILKELLKKMGITIWEKEGFEADDIIGTIAAATNEKTFIVTGDRDSFQLINDSTTVLLTRRGISEIYPVDEAELMKSYFLTPSQIIDYKALAGDSSDNIPGVAGVGDKTALALLKDYNTVEGVYENVDKIKGKLVEKLIASKDNAFLSKTLATIDTKVPIDFRLSDCGFDFPFKREVKDYFLSLNFRSLANKAELFLFDDGAKDSFGKTEKAQISVTEIKIEKLEQIASIISQSSVLSLCFAQDAKKIAIQEIHFAVDEKTEYILNLSENLIDAGFAFDDCARALKPFLENRAVLKVLFDAKVIKKVFIKSGINIFNYFDTRLAQYVLDVTSDYLEFRNLAYIYNVSEKATAAGMISVMNAEEEQLASDNLSGLYFDLELPLVETLFEMESNGFCVDHLALNRLGGEYESELLLLEKEICDIAGKQFNVNSPKQLAAVLFEDMQIPYPKRSKKLSTSAEILEEIDHPIIEKIQNYRFVSKLKSTYVDGLKTNAGASNIIHTDFKQMQTTTGRLSSAEPNLQNIPIREEKGKLLREVFVPRGDDRFLVSADYSQIELRLMAHYSKDPTMIAAYKNGEDIHTSTAAAVFSVPLKDVTLKMRRDAKAVNFGIIYGISEFGLAKNLKIPPYKAREFIDNYFEHFKNVKTYLEKSVQEAKEKGYAETLLKRRRKIPELFSQNQNIVKFGERAAMNMPLQGSAADIIKLAMLKVFKALQGMKSKLVLQVHDELIVDATMDELQEVKRILKENMENVIPLLVPLTVDVEEGKTWNIK